jgi:hypothetical protein
MPEEAKQRQTNPEVALRRHITKGIRPFLAPLAEWNRTAPRHLAVIASPYSSAPDRAKACAAVLAILRQLQEAKSAFRAVAEILPAHDRVDDLQASMNRLYSRLFQAVTEYASEAPRPAARNPAQDVEHEMSVVR